MLIAAMVFVAMLAVLIVVMILYKDELAHYAGFLRYRPADSNARLGVDVPLPGCKDLVRQINAQFDVAFERERKMRKDEEDLLQGLAGLSHDIRTPLAGAKGYLQLASAENDEAERANCMAMAEDRLDVMQLLLDQLFDYMRSVSSQEELETEEVDFVAVLASALAGNHLAFAERGWEPSIELGEGSLMVHADEAALKRIFENVIANMLKHGAGDVRITLSDDMLIFSNAIRLGDAIDCEAVFDPFYRGDLSRTSPGAGLGLPVVKGLADQMGMSVSAAVQDGTFVITLGDFG